MVSPRDVAILAGLAILAVLPGRMVRRRSWLWLAPPVVVALHPMPMLFRLHEEDLAWVLATTAIQGAFLVLAIAATALSATTGGRWRGPSMSAWS